MPQLVQLDHHLEIAAFCPLTPTSVYQRWSWRTSLSGSTPSARCSHASRANDRGDQGTRGLPLLLRCSRPHSPRRHSSRHWCRRRSKKWIGSYVSEGYSAVTTVTGGGRGSFWWRVRICCFSGNQNFPSLSLSKNASSSEAKEV